jgi:hypothetical protein
MHRQQALPLDMLAMLTEIPIPDDHFWDDGPLAAAAATDKSNSHRNKATSIVNNEGKTLLLPTTLLPIHWLHSMRVLKLAML